MDAVRGQDEEVILVGDGLGADLRLSDDQVLHFVVTEGTTDTELAVNAVVEDATIGSLDP